MSKQQDATLNASDAYKKRYAEYQQIYCETSCAMIPPPEPMMDPNNPNPKGAVNRGVQRTVLKRNVRYNDPKTRQTTKPSS